MISTFVKRSLAALRERPLSAISILHDFKLNPSSSKNIQFPTEEPDGFEKHEWTPTEQRSGVLANKKGMISMWDQWGVKQPVTVLQLEDTFVVGHRVKQVHGYDALIVGCKRKNVDSEKDVKSFLFHIESCIKAKIGMCLEKLTEFNITPKGFIPIGTRLNAAHFTPGQFVDIQAKSKEKGFQGVMKRWGFKGQPASHGASLSHRSGGSIGQRKTPGKVFKGRKMPGHMGGEHVTTLNLEVLKVDRVVNLLYVKGTVPGKDSFVKVRDAFFKRDQFDPYVNPPAFPTITAEDLAALPIEWQKDVTAVDPIAKKYKL